MRFMSGSGGLEQTGWGEANKTTHVYVSLMLSTCSKLCVPAALFAAYELTVRNYVRACIVLCGHYNDGDKRT